MDKVVITIVNPEVIALFQKLKKGTSKRFAVERAMEMLYNDEKAKELLFDTTETEPAENMAVADSAPKKPKAETDSKEPLPTDNDEVQPTAPQTTSSVKKIEF